MGLFTSSKESGGSERSALKSIAIATLGGTQISLTLLEKITDGVPIPFVKAAAATAVEVIKIARVIHENGKDCDDLIKRSTSLLVVVLDSLKGKKEHEIPSDLRGAVERLSSNFHEVLAELKLVEKRAGKTRVRDKFKAGLYHFDNADKLRDCSAKLDWALQEFQVVSKVDSCLKDLERHEEVRKGQIELKHGQKELRDGQKEILDAVKTNTAAGALPTSPSTVMPANPRIFGRQEYVTTAVNLIISNNSARLAILGPGGMGKTSVALKIAHDSQVINKFGKNCHWAPCEQALSLDLLVEILAKSLNLPSSTSNDRFGDVVAFLESSNHPHLIFLDNFETPWDIPGKQSDISDILARLGEIPSISFVLTMRGSQHPASDRVDWSKPHLPPLTQLDASAAQEAFVRIAPDAANDPRLDILLKELDFMPLAITLMAKLAEAGEQPSQLLLQWRSEKTRLLSQPEGDRRNSIEISIKLSTDSRAVKGHPEAMNLLSLLAVLPAGAYLSRLPDICPSIPNWKAAIRVLKGAALVYDGADGKSVKLLSPIQSYVLLHHPLEAIPLHDLQKAYCTLASKGDSRPGDTDFLENVKELGSEKANLETVLMGALCQSYGEKDWVIQASLSYSRFLCWTQPQSSIIAAAADTARTSKSILLAECLQFLGTILSMQSNYNDAYSTIYSARAEFLELGSDLGATQCLRTLSDILSKQGKYDEACSSLETARAEFVRMGDKYETAQIIRFLGDTQYLQGKYNDAMSSLQTARAEFVGLGEDLAAANCLTSIGQVLWSQHKYDDAYLSLETARKEFVRLGVILGETQCLEYLGDVLQEMGRYDEAFSNLEKARASYLSIGDRLGAALSLASLGGLAQVLQKYDLAQRQLEEAREQLISLHQAAWVTWCTRQLESVHEAQKQMLEADS